MVIRINENSLICPSDIHVRKLFFLVCPRNPRIIMVMIGLMISTNPMKMTTGRAMFPICSKLTCDPSNTKNMTMKKSLNGLILLVISNLYDEFAKVIHAINVPISMPNPSRWNNAQRMKHRPIENKNRYSWDSAIFFVILGMKYLLRRYIPPTNPIALRISKTMILADCICSMLLNVAIPIMSSMTIRS